MSKLPFEEPVWKPLKSAPRKKAKTITLLGTTDTTTEYFYDIQGKWDEQLECFVSKTGWVIAAVAWR